MSEHSLRSIWIAVVLILACPLVAAGQDAEAEVKSVMAAFKVAQESLDAEAVEPFLAPKFTLTSYNCGTGEESRDPRDEVLDDLRQLAATGASYTKDVSGRTISFLGGGPIAVVRQSTNETMSWESGSLSLQASETYFLNQIGGSYKITSASTRTLCESMRMSGTLPEIPEGN